MWQGDPLSLALFILVVVVLPRPLMQAGSRDLIEGIVSHEEFRGIKSLQFADDKLLFCAGNKESIVAAKAILLAFQGATGLKLN